MLPQMISEDPQHQQPLPRSALISVHARSRTLQGPVGVRIIGVLRHMSTQMHFHAPFDLSSGCGCQDVKSILACMVVPSPVG